MHRRFRLRLQTRRLLPPLIRLRLQTNRLLPPLIRLRLQTNRLLPPLIRLRLQTNRLLPPLIRLRLHPRCRACRRRRSTFHRRLFRRHLRLPQQSQRDLRPPPKRRRRLRLHVPRHSRDFPR